MRAAVLVLLGASAAGAWEGHLASDGQLQRWSFESGQPLVVRLIAPPAGLQLKPGSDLRVALTQAAETWESVDAAHVPARYLGQVGARAPQAGEVLISLDVGPAFIGGHDVAGFTELTLDGHFILAALVHLNFGDFAWATDGSTDALDVQSVAAHEIGHALGLAHPCGDADTNTPSCTALPPAEIQALEQDVMFPSIAPGPRRALAADDAAGVAALLPVPNGAEPAPQLAGLTPGCLQQTELVGPGLAQDVQVALSQPQSDLTVLELLDGDAVVGQASLGRDAKNDLLAVIPADALRALTPLDGRLVARSGKTGVLFDALEVTSSCHHHGCGSSNSSALGTLAALLFVLRRRRSNFHRKAARSAKIFFFKTKNIFESIAASRWMLLLLLWSASAPAFAYVRTVNNGGLCIWWSTRGHSFQIDAQGTPDVPGLAAFTAIRKSFQTWSGVTCSDLAFPDQGLSQDPKDRVVGYFPGQYNRNLVLFRTKSCLTVVPPGDACLTQGGCGNLYDCWDHGDGVIATTTTTSNRLTGQINDADIELNDSTGSDGTKLTFTALDGNPCSDPNQTDCVRIDVQNTVTHESGHSIGLAHTPDPQATMFATAAEGEVSKRTLGADDIRAVCDIYPKGARTVTCADDPIKLTATGSSNGGCGCSHSQTGPGAVLGALVLLLQISRRSRRRPQLAMSPSSAAPRAILRDSGHAS